MNEASIQKFEERALDFPERAKLIVIENNEGLTVANGFLLGIKALAKEIKDFFKPLKDKAKAAHQALVDRERALLDPIEQAEGIVKPRIAGYLNEQERLRREEEEAVRKAEEERVLLERHAQILEEAGKAEEAEQMKNDIPKQEVYIPREAPKLQGAGIRKIPKWRVVNEKLIPREYLMIDSAKIWKDVKSSSGTIRIPGIEVYLEDSVFASRG